MNRWKQEQILVKTVNQANCSHKKRNQTFFTAVSQKYAIAEEICDNCGKLLTVLTFKAYFPTLLTVGTVYNVKKEKVA
jgi:transcription elongation factor Elf1